ncbi:hypothetical protein [Iningainema tapete]|uniref:Glycosyltransferase family 1 protein n=1 Tax=Iningainema tapete BLCC-T55 TaxID=2748662 RepID=A0A8J6XJX7_9CYAN|nr:hypothetical protein [Iningainema tapete]MBD2771727.1 hypothetical protein [Iningainema tapete BLCC-T55]
MVDQLPPIYFYIPQRQWPAGNLPQKPEEYWQWMSAWGSRYGRGRYDWTLQTYLYLKADDLKCDLIGTIPNSGIVVAHREFLPDDFQPSPNLLLVCIKADKDAHPYAQLHIAQNPEDEILHRILPIWKSHYLPHWPQPGLIPRDSSRGERFEKVAFYGVTGTLAPELQQPTWEKELAALGLRWEIVDSQHWHDYSETDVIIAVRSFNGEIYASKPPSKLYNAWHAGIPAILGCESAYRNERKSELDYLEVATLDSAIATLKRLRDDYNLRQAMIENGYIRAQERGTTNITAQWRTFLTDIATPAYYHWCKASSWQQNIFLMTRYFIFKVNTRLLKKFRSSP